MPYNLNFDIYYSKDRCDYIKSQDLTGLSKKELEAISNYILYGKDEDDRSQFDKGLISKVDTKFSSYNKNQPVSLEALLESPTFNENQLIQGKYIYKKAKPEINRDKVKDVKGMKELWEEIDYL